MKLFTPGPVHVSKDTLEQLAKPCDTHRSKWYYDLHKEAAGRLKRLMFTENDVFIGAFSGTGFMEACV
nr:alanine--glyoxylate aminotransferase family protein [Candidatus Sigynarchaeota archaeon]